MDAETLLPPRGAMERAIEWSQALGYLADADGRDYWETAREMERALGADCDGHAVGCLQRFAEHCRRPLPPVYLVLGETRGGGHAWIEIELDGEILWGDPTPGYGAGLHRPGYWARTARYAYQFDGATFGQGFEYGT
jgi:hypothetical protein